jgi:hypothetical protein
MIFVGQCILQMSYKVEKLIEKCLLLLQVPVHSRNYVFLFAVLRSVGHGFYIPSRTIKEWKNNFSIAFGQNCTEKAYY